MDPRDEAKPLADYAAAGITAPRRRSRLLSQG